MIGIERERGGLPLSRIVAIIIALALLGPLPIGATPVASAVADDGELNCSDARLPSRDDVSSAAIDLPFVVDWAGVEFDQVFVNSNGTLSAFRTFGQFDPYDLREVTIPVFAPFWSDFDLSRGGAVTWGSGELDGDAAFCVRFRDVPGFGLSPTLTNSFDVVLVERTSGDERYVEVQYDYHRITWDLGALNSESAVAGLTNGDAGTVVQFAGSGTSGALVDDGPEALVRADLGGPEPGRAVIDLRSSGRQTLDGTVVDDEGVGVAGALVVGCSTNQVAVCRRATSGDDGRFSITGLDGVVDLRASRDDGTIPASARVDAGGPVDITLALSEPAPPPADIELSPITYGSGSTPMVLYSDDLDVVVPGCAGGVGWFVFRAADGTARSGALRELEPGRHHGTVGAVYAAGRGSLHVEIDCGDEVGRADEFDVFVDPSGLVRSAGRRRPLPAAIVTVFRADHIDGPYDIVTDPLMLDADIAVLNPQPVGPDGTFRWDPSPGWYRVEATAPGCDGVARSSSFRAPGLPLGLVLDLPCGDEPETQTCLGLVATIVGRGRIVGTDGDDVIVGSAGSDMIWGGAGDDVICGGDGADMLTGGPGADRMSGGTGRDIVDYSLSPSGVQVSIGASEADGVAGEGDSVGGDIEVVIGSIYDDMIVGSDGDDTLRGLAGHDVIRGRGGNDDLFGGAGVDSLVGGPGDDLLHGGLDIDRCRGGEGSDGADSCEIVRDAEN